MHDPSRNASATRRRPKRVADTPLLVLLQAPCDDKPKRRASLTCRLACRNRRADGWRDAMYVSPTATTRGEVARQVDGREQRCVRAREAARAVRVRLPRGAARTGAGIAVVSGATRSSHAGAAFV
jgi:hypothetical protein